MEHRAFHGNMHGLFTIGKAHPASVPRSKVYSRPATLSVRLSTFRSEFISSASSEKTTFTMVRSKRPRTTLRIGICSRPNQMRDAHMKLTHCLPPPNYKPHVAPPPPR